MMPVPNQISEKVVQDSYQRCGTGGAEIILRSEAGAEIIFKKIFTAVRLKDARMKKNQFKPPLVWYYRTTGTVSGSGAKIRDKGGAGNK